MSPLSESSFEMCLLFDFYGAMLTERQQEVFDLYYNDDLSLSEISEQTGITRQGVRDSLTRSKNVLTDMEEKLSLASKYLALQKSLEKINMLCGELLTADISAKSRDKLIEIYELSRQNRRQQ